MRPAELEACDLAFDAQGLPHSPRYQDRYHPQAGAAEQAQAVFLKGSGLPERWRGRAHFSIVETGFGLGHNFMATWRAWRADGPQACRGLSYFAIERHPPTAAQWRKAHGLPCPSKPQLAGPDNEHAVLASSLLAHWPPPTPGLHLIELEQGRVRLLLAWGDVATWARERVGLADAFYLDGFAPERNPAMWQPDLLKALTRRSAADATAATWCVAARVREGLQAAGFEVQRETGFANKRHRLQAQRRTERVGLPGAPDQRRPASLAPGDGHVLVVGAGLAGCATARALLSRGISVSLVDAAPEPAMATSGNPAGIFHGVLHQPDSVHARLHRAAALHAARDVRQLALTHTLPHGFGLLRYEPGAEASALMQHWQQLRWPPAAAADEAGLAHPYAQALDASRATEHSGLALPHAAWWFAQGGWVDPAALCRAWLAEAMRMSAIATQRAAFMWHGATRIEALRRTDGAWQCDALPAQTFDAVVVAAAGTGTQALLAPHTDVASWKLMPVRGQVMVLPPKASPATRLRCAVAGEGYAVPLPDGRVFIGSTTHSGSADASVRAEDFAALQERAQRFGLLDASDLPAEPVLQRAGVRWLCPDRLPVIGPVVDPNATAMSATTITRPNTTPAARLDQNRFVPRVPGLWCFAALGSRGIGWAAWGAELIASAMVGEPCALESSLLDRVDAARFATRAARLRQTEAADSA